MIGVAPIAASGCTASALECSVDVTPHQLRASFATLLLNAGASVLTVQALLGHKHVDTTMRYARVYDSTVAADYVQAIFQASGIGLLPMSTSHPSSDGEM